MDEPLKLKDMILLIGGAVIGFILEFSKRWTVETTTDYGKKEKEYFNKHQDDLLKIRDDPKISRIIKVLKLLKYKIKQNENYYEKLKQVKENYMEEYDRYPSEVESKVESL